MLKNGAVLAVLFLSVSFAAAQEYPFDVSVGAGPALSRSTSGNQTTQTVTESYVALATVRINLSRRSSGEFTYSRIRNTQEYFSSPYQYRIQDGITEYSGAYVFRPFRWNKFRPFALAGGGILRFKPDSKGVTVNQILTPLAQVEQNRPAFLYGAGVDYRVTKRWSARLQYRGFLYEAPDFKVTNLFTGATGHLAEPSVGVVYRF